MITLTKLRGLLEAEGFGGEVFDDASTRIVYGTDNSIYQLHPVGAVVPNTARDLEVLARVNSRLAEPFELCPRGGGTGTNGQSLTNGLVVDTRRAMNRILSIDPEAMEAVVEPGVVLDQLNVALAPYGLFFAPHVSTATRATIGGMTSTDAAGKGSLVHGRTNDHVIELDAVLADGTSLTVRSTTIAEAEAAAQQSDRIGDLHRLVLEATEGISPDSFPDIPRGFTGYNLADARTEFDLDMTKLLCGSEGTLALISRIRVRLTALPEDLHLAVIAYPQFEDAVRDSNRLKVTRPIAIECLDEHTIRLARQSPQWAMLASLLDAEGASLLLLEFEGKDGPQALRTVLAEAPGAMGMVVTADAAQITAVWKVRADAVGFLGQSVGGRRSLPFVEDCAVPPANLEAFVAEYRRLLDGHGLSYGMFGHADVGCVHVRPALDLYQPEHESLLRTISDDVAQLVSNFGGVLWGEHGRGFRGEYLDLDDTVIQKMRMVKTAFDPRNTLNPGKLYTPLEVEHPIRRIDEVPLRVHSDRTVAEAHRRQFQSAFDCNGNGICHHWGAAEVMCPSFKTTADPRLSPKGRADLLREWLTRPDDEALALDVADSLHQCLSCAACTGRCPLQVDIPELKSRFLEKRPETIRTRRIRTAFLSRFEELLPSVQAFAPVIGFAQRLASPTLSRVLGIVDLPVVPPGNLATRLARQDVKLLARNDHPGDATVVILPDAFTAYLDPEVLRATVSLLQMMGERPAVARFVPSGKFDHVKGRRERFAKAVAAQRASIERLGRPGVDLVVIEPAIALLHRHEYPASDPTFPSNDVVSLPEFLAERLDAIPTGKAIGTVQLFDHCSEVSLMPHSTAAYRAVLERAGYDVEEQSTTCCGMAGVFGHEAENQNMSRNLFSDYWAPLLARPGPVGRCASGYSCRSQSRRLDSAALDHPVVLAVTAFAASDQHQLRYQARG
ncbi:MAG: FAD-binding oxidoreductase [Acidimicrobiales bacterium]|nr:FAD-binding oxidoreductase [Acidimicrobiales bacterium]